MERLIELLERVLGPGRTTNRGNHAFHCPFCNSNAKKLEVQIISTVAGENHWHCWTCNASGKKIVNLLKRLHLPREIVAEASAILNISSRYSTGNDSEYTSRVVRLPDEYRPLWKSTNNVEQKNALKYLIQIGRAHV